MMLASAVVLSSLMGAAHAGEKHDVRGVATGMFYRDALAVAVADGGRCVETAPLVADCTFENHGRMTVKGTTHLTPPKVFFVGCRFHLAAPDDLPHVMQRFDAGFRGRCQVDHFDDPNNCDLQRVDEGIVQDDFDADLVGRR